jgi:carbonic anhydrase
MSLFFDGGRASGNPFISSLPLTALLKTNQTSLDLDPSLSLSALLPLPLDQLLSSTYHLQYTGSLPAPPCTPDVTWLLLLTRLPVLSPADVSQLKAVAEYAEQRGVPTRKLAGRVLSVS